MLVDHQPPEHLIADPSLQRPDRLRLGVAGPHALGNLIPPWPGNSKLRHRDPVQRQVELTIAIPVQTMADVVARPDGNGRQPSPARLPTVGGRAGAGRRSSPSMTRFSSS